MLRVFLLIVALCVSLPAYAQRNGIYDRAGGNSSAGQSNQKPANVAEPNYLPAISARLGQIARLLDSQIADEQSSKNEDRAERNVKAQENVADYAPWMLVLGFVEIVITGVGVLLVRKTINESRAATEDDIRPYVQLSRCKFERIRGRTRFIVRIQNSGSTPATHFSVKFKAVAIAKTVNGPLWSIPQDNALAVQTWNALGGDDSVTVGLSEKDLNKIAQSVVDDENLILFVVGKVTYGDIWENEYETEFAYWTYDALPTTITSPVNGTTKNVTRKMSRATGKLRTFEIVKAAKKKRMFWTRAA